MNLLLLSLYVMSGSATALFALNGAIGEMGRKIVAAQTPHELRSVYAALFIGLVQTFICWPVHWIVLAVLVATREDDS